MGEILRIGSEEPAGDSIADAAVVVGPALVVAAILSVFIPFLDQLGLLLAVVLLAVAAGVLSLGWRPGGVPGRARTATAMAGVALGLAAAAFGSAANPCVAQPAFVALASVVLFDGTLLGAVALGRVTARQRRVAAPLLVAGGVGLIGFFTSLMVIGQSVFVLC